MIEECSLRLFKSIVVPEDVEIHNNNSEINKRTIQYGFIFSDELLKKYSGNISNIATIVENMYGKDAIKLNQTLHKSFSTVMNSDIMELVVQQIMHYFTTYGFEQLGIKDDYVYIPKEKLDIPDLDEDINLLVIKSMTIDELKESIQILIRSGIALSDNTIQDIMNLIEYYDLKLDNLDQIKNNEIKSALYDYYNYVPENNVEFLRYIIYRLTGETLLIKNKNLINKIKSNLNNNRELNRRLVSDFRNYEKNVGLESLSEIFYRFKPIWLAMRDSKIMRIYINRIRRLAVKNHKPLKQDLLSVLTKKKVSEKTLKENLEDKSIFRKIRLLNSISYRLTGNKEFLYRIRNGKSFVKVNDKLKDKNELYSMYYNVILESIVKDIELNVKDKKIYIPNNVVYTMPSSEKQFIGNIPNNSYISTGSKMVTGIHWFNNENRIDLDLKLQNADHMFGWDASYRNRYEEIAFTGDITDAPEPYGAFEAYYIGDDSKSSYILVVNNFTYSISQDTEFKFILDYPEEDRINQDYIINVNTVQASIKLDMNNCSKKILGLIRDVNGEKRFYFSDFSIGKGITSKMTDDMNNAYKYLDNYNKCLITLNEVLKLSGAIIVDNKEDCDIDLSLENITKDSIIKLLVKDV